MQLQKAQHIPHDAKKWNTVNYSIFVSQNNNLLSAGTDSKGTQCFRSTNFIFVNCGDMFHKNTIRAKFCPRQTMFSQLHNVHDFPQLVEIQSRTLNGVNISGKTSSRKFYALPQCQPGNKFNLLWGFLLPKREESWEVDASGLPPSALFDVAKVRFDLLKHKRNEKRCGINTEMLLQMGKTQ